MKDKSETYIVDDFLYDLKKMTEEIKKAKQEVKKVVKVER